MTSPQQTAPDSAALHATLRTLVRVALIDLQNVEGTPTFATLPDHSGWNRFGQREFGAQLRDAWAISPRVSHHRWLDSFPEMAGLRSAAAKDPVLDQRLRCGMGLEFSMTGPINLGWSVVKNVIEPMVRRSRTYVFDERSFDEAADRLLLGLRADRARLVGFVPLNALRVTTDVGEVRLPGDLTLKAMSDRQVGAAIRYQAVRVEPGGAPTFVFVDPEHQWALTTERDFPVISEMPDRPTAPAFPALDEPADRLVQALRLVGGGSVIATRSLRLQHDDDFPLLAGSSAVLSSLPAVDYTRPTLLTGADVADVAKVFARLGEPDIQADRLLRLALGRFVIGGSQVDPAQRLTDLMTCLEVVLIKRMGIDDARHKSVHLRRGAARLLGDDPVIGLSFRQIEAFVLAAYRKRNAYMHGDDPHDGPLVLLDATPAATLTAMVDAAEFLTRRVLYQILTRP